MAASSPPRKPTMAEAYLRHSSPVREAQRIQPLTSAELSKLQQVMIRLNFNQAYTMTNFWLFPAWLLWE